MKNYRCKYIWYIYISDLFFIRFVSLNIEYFTRFATKCSIISRMRSLFCPTKRRVALQLYAILFVPKAFFHGSCVNLT